MRRGDARRFYSADRRMEALALADAYGGNVQRVSRELEIPASTIRQWRMLQRAAGDAAVISQADPHHGAINHGEILSRVIVAGAQRLLELLPTAENPREIAVAVGIAVDKFLDITQGRRGHTVNVDARSVQIGANLTDDDRHAVLAAALGQAAGDVATLLPSPGDTTPHE